MAKRERLGKVRFNWFMVVKNIRTNQAVGFGQARNRLSDAGSGKSGSVPLFTSRGRRTGFAGLQAQRPPRGAAQYT